MINLVKVHASFVTGPFEVWLRYVQDGYTHPPQREVYETVKPDTISLEDWVKGRTIENRQTTLTFSYKEDLSASWSVQALQSFDTWEFTDRRASTFLNNPEREAHEQESFSRAIFTWSPNEKHLLALGSEYSHEAFYDPAQSDALDRDPVILSRSWETNTISFLSEYQWKPCHEFTSFLSARTDKHTYSDVLYSPRVTFVFTPSDNDTVKLMAGESLRRGDDEELYAENVRSGTTPDAESLRFYEISYDRRLGDSWSLGTSAFYSDYDALGWNGSQSTQLGKFQIAGGEVFLRYSTSATRIEFSTGLSELVDSSVPGTPPDLGGAWQGITAQPYGYGSDLAEWSKYISKVGVVQKIAEEWKVSTSLVYYWGFDGAEDLARYNSELVRPSRYVPPAPLVDSGYDDPFGPNLYWNLGVQYEPTPSWIIRIDGYNLASIFDQKISKRNYYSRLSEYVAYPATLGLSLRYKF